MKLAFSTDYWKGLSWADYVTLASDLQFSGIEIHDIEEKAFTENGAIFSDMMPTAARKLANLGISIPCIDTVFNMADTARERENLDTLQHYLTSAKGVHCPYVRLYAKAEEMTVDEADAASVAFLRKAIPMAEKMGVVLLVETAGVYADTARLAKVLGIFASDSLGALWDLSHPYRLFGEEPEKTVENLGAYIKHVHIKDIKNVGDQVSYCLMGEGILPVDRFINALRSVIFDGCLSFEWNPEWEAELADPEIVFPHFVTYMERFAPQARRAQAMYTNRSGTGRFIWPKYTLVNETFGSLLDKVVEHFPDQLAFRYTTLDYTRTYAEFRDDVDAFARALIAIGVKPGSHVTVWATNVPAWFIAFWATTKIGAALVTMNTAYKVHEAEYLLRQSDTHTLILVDGWRDSDYIGIIKELCPELETTKVGEPLHAKRLPFLRNVITVDSRQNGCMTWEDALEKGKEVPQDEVMRLASLVKPDDVCNMQYTSGTTGFPKGVMLTHYNVINNGKCIGDKMDLSTADRMMIQVPMFHCFGMVLSMTSSMTHGATLYPLPYFSPKPALSCIHREHITAFNGVPTMFIAMLRHEDFEKTDFSYIRTGIMAGANCPADLMREAIEKMNMTEIVSVYGQTEASPGCTMSFVEDSVEVRTETVGSAFPNVECKIIDPETGLDLPDGENGEFVARGYNVMKGYYKMPLATAAAIDSEGWLHTGDIACRDSDGNYRITGRLKDMIIRGGENIYPREIEEFIFTSPKVKDVQVIGVPDKRYGEEIMACIILKEGETMTVEELKAFVTAHMARHKVPRYVEFVSEFPMNAAGKILKYKMRENAIAKYNLST
ncbi:MAG: AMP-binding protein [Clostridia bacterium]|nr:AMP-binding protein [Clostridia bacterium]